MRYVRRGDDDSLLFVCYVEENIPPARVESWINFHQQAVVKIALRVDMEGMTSSLAF